MRRRRARAERSSFFSDPDDIISDPVGSAGVDDDNVSLKSTGVGVPVDVRQASDAQHTGRTEVSVLEDD